MRKTLATFVTHAFAEQSAKGWTQLCSENETAMPRGSKPGERRGGRQRATPNKRTVLTDRILAAASCHPTATRPELLLILAKDQALPADIRMAIVRKSFPAVTSRSIEGSAEKPLAWMPQSIERSPNPELDGGTDKIRLTGNRAVRAAKMGPRAFPALELLLSIAQDCAHRVIATSNSD